MLKSIYARLRIWHLRQLRMESYRMLLSSRNPIVRGAIQSNLRDYAEEIQRLSKANRSDQRLHG